MEKIGGYMGKVLKVDLSRKKIYIDDLERNFALMYVGGYGFGARILYDMVPAWVSAFDPLNLLIFATGPVTGTLAQTAARHTVISKSPLTGYFGDASSGGFFGPELKFSGFDMIVISGKSSKPVYLWVNDGKVEIKDANPYWGMDAREVERAIKNDLGEDGAKVACIGQAGENLVRIAGIMNDEAGRAAARCGLGAVMGSKKLKAVVVKGTQKVPVADEELLRKVMKRVIEFYRTNPYLQGFRGSGTRGRLMFFWELGTMPSYNWANEIYGEYKPDFIAWDGDYRKLIHKGIKTCYNCILACRSIAEVTDGPYKTDGKVEGPEYETLASLGGCCGITDIKALTKANDLCNLYGMDTISVGMTISFAMECFEKGIINKEDTDGIELKFGNTEAMIEMIHRIAQRKGFGDILAEGSRRASLIIGNGAEYYAIHTKGQEIATHDPRAFQAGGPHYACSPTGGRHMEGFPLQIEVGKRPWLGYPDTVDRFLTERKGEVAKRIEDWWHFLASAGWCLFADGHAKYGGEDNFLETYKAITGITITREDALKIGERIFNLKRCFNIKHGHTKKEDTLPERLLKEPNKRAKDAIVKLNETLPQYYDARGWDHKTGKPKKEKLIELGLDDVAKDLWPE